MEVMSRWRREHRFVVSAICGTICLVAGPALGAEHAFDGVYSGKRSLVKGSDPTCVTQEDVSVTIHGETLTFTNSDLKKAGISFYPGRDGSFGETYVDEGGDTVKIHGRVIGNVIEADVTNPPCEHHWHLTKENRGH
jgi:hypothetical protein